MLTLTLLAVAFLILALLLMVACGIIGVLSPVLVIVGFVALDVLIFKLIFGRKKKK